MSEAHENDIDPSLLRQAFGFFPSGVMAFCGFLNGRPLGLVASSFTSVSLDPPLVSVCVANTSSTWSRLAELDLLGLSVLAGTHNDVAKHLSAKGNDDRFLNVGWTTSENGCVFVRGASLWLECVPHNVVPAGDHKIVILRVAQLWMHPEVPPMVFHRSAFQELEIPRARA